MSLPYLTLTRADPRLERISPSSPTAHPEAILPPIIGIKRQREVEDVTRNEDWGGCSPGRKRLMIEEAVHDAKHGRVDDIEIPFKELKEESPPKDAEKKTPSANTEKDGPGSSGRVSSPQPKQNGLLTPTSSISSPSSDEMRRQERADTTTNTMPVEATDKVSEGISAEVSTLTKETNTSHEPKDESPGLMRVQCDDASFTKKMEDIANGHGGMMKGRVAGQECFVYQELALAESEFETEEKEFHEKTEASDDKLSGLREDIICLEQRMEYREKGPTKRQIKKLARLQANLACAYKQGDEIIKVFKAYADQKNAAEQHYLSLDAECSRMFTAARKTVQFPATKTKGLLTEVNLKALDDVSLTSNDRWRLRPWKRGMDFGLNSISPGRSEHELAINSSEEESFDEEEMLQADKKLKEAQIQHTKILLKYEKHMGSYEEQYQIFRLDFNYPLNKESEEMFAPIFIKRGHTITKELKEAEDAVQTAKVLAMNSGVRIHWCQESHFPERYDLKEHQLAKKFRFDEEYIQSWIFGIQEPEGEHKHSSKRLLHDEEDKDERRVPKTVETSQSSTFAYVNPWKRFRGKKEAHQEGERNARPGPLNNNNTELPILDSDGDTDAGWESTSPPDPYYDSCWDTRSALPTENRRQKYIDAWAKSTRRGYR